MMENDAILSAYKKVLAAIGPLTYAIPWSGVAAPARVTLARKPASNGETVVRSQSRGIRPPRGCNT